MAAKSRLERLHKHIQADLAALPDHPLEPIISDSDASGGVALDSVDVPCEQTAADVLQPEPKPIIAEPNTDRRHVWLKDAQSSYKPAPTQPTSTSTTPASSPKPAAPLPASNLNCGDLGPATQHYTPIVALSKYPYKWCNKEHSQAIASTFFDQGKFWAREWDL